MEELKTQLHRAEEEQRVKELSTNLESETNKNKTLCNQVEYLTIKLHKEGERRKQLANPCQKERSIVFEQYTLNIQLGKQLKEIERRLAEQMWQNEWVGLEQCQTHLSVQ